MRNILHGVDVRLLDMDTWPTADEDSLSDECRETCNRRRRAVTIVVLTYGNVNLAVAETGISKSEVGRVFRRCIGTHRDGQIAGFRACVPHHAVKKYVLNDETKTGFAGLLGRLFRQHPIIEKKLIQFATSRRAGELTLPVQISELSFKLIDLCRDEGFLANEYPISAQESAEKPLRLWYERLRDTMGRAILRAELGEDAAKECDDGHEAYVPPVDPHRIMVFDEWTAHAFTAVEIMGPSGGKIWVPISRYKFINGIRRGDRTICACLPVLRKEPDVAEFLRVVESAIRPHQRREFTVPGYDYPPKPAFTSDVPDGEWLLPDLVFLDRSLVHLAVESRLGITKGMGCILLYGPPQRPKVRGDVEAWHSFLAAKVRKFPSTTGGGPKDPARNNPEKHAIRLCFHHDLLAQLIEMLRVEYCTSGKKSLKGHSPIEKFQHWAGNSSTILRHLPSDQHEKFSLSELRVQVRISCDEKSGRQPVVRFKYADYCGPRLAHMRSRNKEDCLLILNRGAAHIGRLYSLKDGCEIDVLHTRGEWRESHTLRERELYHDFNVSQHVKLRDRGKSRVQQLREYCERLAASDKDMALIHADICKSEPNSSSDAKIETQANQSSVSDQSTEHLWQELNRLADKKPWESTL